MEDRRRAFRFGTTVHRLGLWPISRGIQLFPSQGVAFPEKGLHARKDVFVSPVGRNSHPSWRVRILRQGGVDLVIERVKLRPI